MTTDIQDRPAAGQAAQAQAGPALPDLPSLLQATAALLGLPADQARDFARDGCLRIDSVELELAPMPRRSGSGPLLMANMTMPRPVQVPAPRWHETLLLANEPSMMVGDWAFGLLEDDEACLSMRLGEELLSPALLRAAIEAMHALCESVREGSIEGARQAGAAA